MKKSLLILSLLAMAANAVAFDELTPGTAEKPNYYLVYANRGNFRYLEYSAEPQEYTRGEDVVESHLTRTSTVGLTNVWAVTPGTEEGSIVMKNYTADAYLAKYFFPGTEGETFQINSTADTQSEPRDIFPIRWETTLAYALNVGSEARPEGGYNSLDAPGGDTKYIGNWQPTNPTANEGTAWWFVNVTPGPGETVESKVADYLKNEALAEKDKAIDVIKAYLPNCGIVAKQLNDGIAAISALPYSDDLVDKINAAKAACFKAANDYLATELNSKYVITNLRRTTQRYLSFNVEGSNLMGINDFTSPNASISFKPCDDGGYFMYNAATQLYLATADRTGENVQVTEKEDEAVVIYPELASFVGPDGQFYGIAFPENPGQQYPLGINMHGTNLTRAVDLWYITTDGYGSIWAMEELNDDVIRANMVESIETAYASYISENIPVAVRNILRQAIADVKALPITADVVAKAIAIQEKGIADANAWLATNLAGQSYYLKNLRRKDYLTVTDEGFAHCEEIDAETEAEAKFEFITSEDGGYFIYNAALGQYICGPEANPTEGGSPVFVMTEDKDDAIIIYVNLAYSGDLRGVAFCEDDTWTGKGLNMSSYEDGLFYYSVADAGAIFGLVPMVPEEDSINAISAAPKAQGIYDLQGRKLAAPVKGINIINGVKVLVK